MKLMSATYSWSWWSDEHERKRCVVLEFVGDGQAVIAFPDGTVEQVDLDKLRVDIPLTIWHLVDDRLAKVPA